MNNDDAWDWPTLIYVATVLLRRTDRQFWRMTPRKLNALTNTHIEMNKTSEDEEPKQRFIDEVVF
jgi:uncharacterized phage protein (TIGR02216 family)